MSPLINKIKTVQPASRGGGERPDHKVLEKKLNEKKGARYEDVIRYMRLKIYFMSLYNLFKQGLYTPYLVYKTLLLY